MKTNFDVLILGSDFNAYYMARCYHEIYHKKVDVIAKKAVGVVSYSKIVNFKEVENFESAETFVTTLNNYAEEKEVETILLIGTSDELVRLIIENKEKLSPKYVHNYPSLEILNHLLVKDVFYQTFENSELDIPKTYNYPCGVQEATDEEKKSNYEMYYDKQEPIKYIPSHRILAINRGEKEEYIKVKIQKPEEKILIYIEKDTIKGETQFTEMLKATILDSFKRLIEPSIDREIRSDLTEKAEEKAIKVFGQNSKQLLLGAPIKGKTVMGFDPAYRTGCKIAVIDETGKVLDYTTVYPTEPQNDVEGAKKELLKLIEKDKIDMIAIGNGTASRESEMFVSDMIKETPREIHYVIVSEAGASVYSASKLATEEYPDINVSIRGAISIARRLQDPLAELVKIDPKAIGVGQYQHDVNQKKLAESLTGVVEDSVNKVGVDVNTATPSLLSYVSGINGTIAKNIVKYRDENGKLKNRKELLKVPKLGKVAFEQCAGFLRIFDGDNPLEITAVHPESYEATKKLLANLGFNKTDLKNKEKIDELRQKLKSVDIAQTAKELEIGEMTLADIISELSKPGRDPREDMPKPILRSDVLKLEDLKEGMVLTGTVRNVTDFGAFVDIGVKHDGLVHISQLSNSFVKNPSNVVSVGDIVKVKVIGIDSERQKVQLSMKKVKKRGFP